MSYHPTMSDEQITALSDALEYHTGYDSVTTIEEHYWMDSPDSSYTCPFPSCKFTRKKAIPMWKHVHFSDHHSLSFPFKWREMTPESLEMVGAPA